MNENTQENSPTRGGSSAVTGCNAVCAECSHFEWNMNAPLPEWNCGANHWRQRTDIEIVHEYIVCADFVKAI